MKELKYIFPRVVDKKYITDVLGFEYGTRKLTPDIIKSKDDKYITDLIQQNVFFALWLLCHMDDKFCKKFNLQFNTISTAIKSYKFNVLEYNIIQMIFLENLLNPDGISGRVDHNAFHLHRIIRICRLKYYMNHLPTNHDDNDKDDMVCQSIINIINYLENEYDEKKFKVYNVTSQTHAMLVYKIPSTNSFYLCNVGEGSTGHPYIINDGIYFTRATIQVNRCPDLIKEPFDTLTTAKVYEELKVITEEHAEREEPAKKYECHHIGSNISFFVHPTEKCVYMTPQVSGTCSYYCIMIYLIICLHYHGFRDKEIATYFKFMFTVLVNSLTIDMRFRDNLDMSKVHAFAHLMQKDNTPNHKEFYSLFLQYKRDYLLKTNYTVVEGEYNSSFPYLDDENGVIMEWSKRLTITDWIDRNVTWRYSQTKYGKIYIQHYMNKVRDLWDTIPKITNKQFINVFNYLNTMLLLNEYSIKAQHKELTDIEGRQLSVTFYGKLQQFILETIPPTLLKHWNALKNCQFSDPLQWKSEVDYFLPYFKDALGDQCNRVNIRKVAVFEQVLSPGYRPGIWTPWIIDGLAVDPDDKEIPTYNPILFNEPSDSLSVLELPLFTTNTRISPSNICTMHESWQILEPNRFANFKIMVQNYLCHIKFQDLSTSLLEPILLLCSHYRVKLQIQNILTDESIVKSWKDTVRFYCYCWAILMCYDEKYSDGYVLRLLGRTTSDDFPLQYSILLHLHNHEEYLYKFCPYDSILYEPLMLHLQNIMGEYVTHKKHLVCHDFGKKWSYHGHTCIHVLNQPKIDAMIHVLRFIATVIVYHDAEKNQLVIDVSAHETEHDHVHIVPKHRWIQKSTDKYWELENSQWRIYDTYTEEEELEWVTFGRSTGCIMLLKSSSGNQYGLLIMVGEYKEASNNKFWLHYSYNNTRKMSYQIIETTMTKSINQESRPMICPVVKNIESLETISFLLSYYISPLTDRIFAMYNSISPNTVNYNSFIVDYDKILNNDTDRHISTQLVKRWLPYWLTQPITIPSSYNVHQFWYDQGGLEPFPHQKIEINNLIRSEGTKRSCMKQYIMGAGKSSVIIPHVILHHLQYALTLDTPYNIIVVQPEHLRTSALLQLSKLGIINRVKVKTEYSCFENDILIQVLTDTQLKQAWKSAVTNDHKIDVLLIDEFDSVCMPCKSDMNICMDRVAGISDQDHLYPELIKWLQYESPFIFIHQLPFRKLSMQEFCSFINIYKKEYKKVCERLLSIYNTCIQWNYNVEYGFRLTGKKASPFVVPYITTGVPHEESEFQSNEVRFVATCLALRQEKRLLPLQQDIYEKHIAIYTRMGISEHKNGELESYMSNYVFSQLFYSTQTQNVNMTDVLLTQRDRIVYAFSGTTAIPVYKKLQINCIHSDPSFLKINYMLNPVMNPEFTEDDYRAFIQEKPTQKLEQWKETINVQLPKSKLLPIEDNDQTLWELLKPFDVIIDSCGFFKNRSHMTLVQDMNKRLNRPIVYIDSQHNVKVYPGNINYPFGNLDTNFERPDKFPNYIYYYDHRHIVGTDIRHPNQLTVLVVTNYSSKRYVVVQAMYRIRGIHDKQNDHQVQFALDVIYIPEIDQETKQLKKGYDPERLITNTHVEKGLKSLRTQSKIWIKNENEEISRNGLYLRYQYKFAKFKLKKDNWIIESFQRKYKSMKTPPMDLQSTVNVRNDVQAQVNLVQTSKKDKCKTDTSGKMIHIHETTGEIDMTATTHITHNVILSDYCFKYFSTSKHNFKHSIFMIHLKKNDIAESHDVVNGIAESHNVVNGIAESHNVVNGIAKSQCFIIHYDELHKNTHSLRPDKHKVSSLYGDQIYPHFIQSTDWVLPMITHAPTISFYSMLETFHNHHITKEFFTLQSVFETRWTLFTPIIYWKNQHDIYSKSFDSKVIEKYKTKIESSESLLRLIRYMISYQQSIIV